MAKFESLTVDGDFYTGSLVAARNFQEKMGFYEPDAYTNPAMVQSTQLRGSISLDMTHIPLVVVIPLAVMRIFEATRTIVVRIFWLIARSHCSMQTSLFIRVPPHPMEFLGR